jgi:ABC-2 type transport system ATP-binding protein
MAASIEVESLAKTFRAGAPVLAGISFRFEGTGAIGYLGPNGAGKTTTLKLLVGLLRPTAGRVSLNDVDPAVDRKRALWDVGALVESPDPYPELNVHEALDTVGRSRGLPPRDVDLEIDRCHDLLELPPLERKVGGLSKGQRQRVSLAATLMGDPPVILLDEPTSGLDPAERVLVRNLMVRLKRDHLIFLSSHQMLEVAEVCDEVVFLNHGRVLLRDRVDGVAARFRNRQLDVEFAAAVPAERAAQLARVAESVTPLSPRRWRVSCDGSDDTRRRLLELCQAVGPVVHFASATLDLEEAYLDLIARPAVVG